MSISQVGRRTSKECVSKYLDLGGRESWLYRQQTRLTERCRRGYIGQDRKRRYHAFEQPFQTARRRFFDRVALRLAKAKRVFTWYKCRRQSKQHTVKPHPRKHDGDPRCKMRRNINNPEIKIISLLFRLFHAVQ